MNENIYSNNKRLTVKAVMGVRRVTVTNDDAYYYYQYLIG